MIPLKWVAVLIVFILGYREVEIITGKTLRTSRVSVVFNAVHLGGGNNALILLSMSILDLMIHARNCACVDFGASD